MKLLVIIIFREISNQICKLIREKKRLKGNVNIKYNFTYFHINTRNSLKTDRKDAPRNRANNRNYPIIIFRQFTLQLGPFKAASVDRKCDNYGFAFCFRLRKLFSRFFL